VPGAPSTFAAIAARQRSVTGGRDPAGLRPAYVVIVRSPRITARLRACAGEFDGIAPGGVVNGSIVFFFRRARAGEGFRNAVGRGQARLARWLI